MSVIIRLQNLPWEAKAIDVRNFFSGLNIPDGGVHIIGGEEGDAFIAFTSDEDARQAMDRDRGKVKGNKIKLKLSSKSEMQRVINVARGSLDMDSEVMQKSDGQQTTGAVGDNLPGKEIPPQSIVDPYSTSQAQQSHQSNPLSQMLGQFSVQNLQNILQSAQQAQPANQFQPNFPANQVPPQNETALGQFSTLAPQPGIPASMNNQNQINVPGSFAPQTSMQYGYSPRMQGVNQMGFLPGQGIPMQPGNFAWQMPGSSQAPPQRASDPFIGSIPGSSQGQLQQRGENYISQKPADVEGPQKQWGEKYTRQTQGNSQGPSQQWGENYASQGPGAAHRFDKDVRMMPGENFSGPMSGNTFPVSAYKGNTGPAQIRENVLRPTNPINVPATINANTRFDIPGSSGQFHQFPPPPPMSNATRMPGGPMRVHERMGNSEFTPYHEVHSVSNQSNMSVQQDAITGGRNMMEEHMLNRPTDTLAPSNMSGSVEARHFLGDGQQLSPQFSNMRHYQENRFSNSEVSNSQNWGKLLMSTQNQSKDYMNKTFPPNRDAMRSETNIDSKRQCLPSYCIEVYNLPPTVTFREIRQLFSDQRGINLSWMDMKLAHNAHGFSGIAYIKLNNERDRLEALQLNNVAFIRGRPVNIRQCPVEAFEAAFDPKYKEISQSRHEREQDFQYRNLADRAGNQSPNRGRDLDFHRSSDMHRQVPNRFGDVNNSSFPGRTSDSLCKNDDSNQPWNQRRDYQNDLSNQLKSGFTDQDNNVPNFRHRTPESGTKMESGFHGATREGRQQYLDRRDQHTISTFSPRNEIENIHPNNVQSHGGPPLMNEQQDRMFRPNVGNESLPDLMSINVDVKRPNRSEKDHERERTGVLNSENVGSRRRGLLDEPEGILPLPFQKWGEQNRMENRDSDKPRHGLYTNTDRVGDKPFETILDPGSERSIRKHEQIRDDQSHQGRFGPGGHFADNIPNQHFSSAIKQDRPVNKSDGLLGASPLDAQNLTFANQSGPTSFKTTASPQHKEPVKISDVDNRTEPRQYKVSGKLENQYEKPFKPPDNSRSKSPTQMQDKRSHSRDRKSPSRRSERRRSRSRDRRSPYSRDRRSPHFREDSRRDRDSRYRSSRRSRDRDATSRSRSDRERRSPHRSRSSRQSSKEKDQEKSKNMASKQYKIIIKGLPIQVGKTEITKFFDKLHIKESDITIEKGKDGLSLGYGSVTLSSSSDVEIALSYSKKKLAHKFVEIFNDGEADKANKTNENSKWKAFPDSSSETKDSDKIHSDEKGGVKFDQTVSKVEKNDSKANEQKVETNIVFMHGLPRGVTADAIITFFKGIELRKEDVHLMMDGKGYVEFSSPKDSTKALQRNRNHIGSRYILLKSSTKDEMEKAMKQHLTAVTSQPVKEALLAENSATEGIGKSEKQQSRDKKDETCLPKTEIKVVDKGLDEKQDIDNKIKKPESRETQNFQRVHPEKHARERMPLVRLEGTPPGPGLMGRFPSPNMPGIMGPVPSLFAGGVRPVFGDFHMRMPPIGPPRGRAPLIPNISESDMEMNKDPLDPNQDEPFFDPTIDQKDNKDEKTPFSFNRDDDRGERSPFKSTEDNWLDRPPFIDRGHGDRGERPTFSERGHGDRGERPPFSDRGHGDRGERPPFNFRDDDSNARPSFNARGNRDRVYESRNNHRSRFFHRDDTPRDRDFPRQNRDDHFGRGHPSENEVPRPLLDEDMYPALDDGDNRHAHDAFQRIPRNEPPDNTNRRTLLDTPADLKKPGDFGSMRSLDGPPPREQYHRPRDGRPELGPPPQPATIRVANLPQKVQVEDIIGFFDGYGIIPGSIRIGLDNRGTPIGEALIDLFSKEEAIKAVRERNQRPLNKRPVSLTIM